MKVLVPVDASSVALAPIAHLQALGASGVEIEVLLLNAQPRFTATSRSSPAGAHAICCARSAASSQWQRRSRR